MTAGSTDDSELDNISQEGLLDLVKDMPDVREDVVSEIGQKLADDPSYPTDEMIDQFSSMLVNTDTSWMDAVDSEAETGDENV